MKCPECGCPVMTAQVRRRGDKEAHEETWCTVCDWEGSARMWKKCPDCHVICLVSNKEIECPECNWKYEEDYHEKK